MKGFWLRDKCRIIAVIGSFYGGFCPWENPFLLIPLLPFDLLLAGHLGLIPASSPGAKSSGIQVNT